MKKRHIITLLLLLGTIGASAQKLTIDKTTVNVGRTGYQKPVTAVFECHVKGGKKLHIQEVRPDCQCTTIDYPRGDVGDHFQIRMTYNGRQLGHFNHQAAIISDGTKKPLYITMTGLVLEHYVDLSANYPVDMGDLHLDRRDIEFDDVNRGEQPVQELHLYNNGMVTYHPNLMHLPPYLTAVMTPEELKSGEEGVMTIRLNSSLLHYDGLTQTSVFLAGNPGDKVSHDNEIGVSTVLLPAFNSAAVNTPSIQLSQETLDIAFDGKEKKTAVIDIQNTGSTELRISSLQMFTTGLKVSLGSSRILPGETTKLRVTAMRNELQQVRTKPRILMITNDPKKPKIVITINAK